MVNKAQFWNMVDEEKASLPPRKISPCWTTTLPPHPSLKYPILNPNFVLACETSESQFVALIEKIVPQYDAYSIFSGIRSTQKSEAVYLGLLKREDTTKSISVDGQKIQLEAGSLYDPWYREIDTNKFKAVATNTSPMFSLGETLMELVLKSSIEGEEIFLHLFTTKREVDNHSANR